MLFDNFKAVSITRKRCRSNTRLYKIKPYIEILCEKIILNSLVG